MPLPQIPKNRPVRLLRKGDIVRVKIGTLTGKKGVVFNYPMKLDDTVVAKVNGTTWIFDAYSLEKLSTRYYYDRI